MGGNEVGQGKASQSVRVTDPPQAIEALRHKHSTQHQEHQEPTQRQTRKHRKATRDHDVCSAQHDERMRVLFYGRVSRLGSRPLTGTPRRPRPCGPRPLPRGSALTRGHLAPERPGYQITPSARWVTSTIRSGSSMSSTG